MHDPKCESDNRGGIKLGDKGGARLEYDCLFRSTKIPHGKTFFDRFSCRLLLPKRIPQLAPANRNFPIKFGADKNHSGSPIILRDGAGETVWAILN